MNYGYSEIILWVLVLGFPVAAILINKWENDAVNKIAVEEDMDMYKRHRFNHSFAQYGFGAYLNNAGWTGVQSKEEEFDITAPARWQMSLWLEYNDRGEKIPIEDRIYPDWFYEDDVTQEKFAKWSFNYDLRANNKMSYDLGRYTGGFPLITTMGKKCNIQPITRVSNAFDPIGFCDGSDDMVTMCRGIAGHNERIEKGLHRIYMFASDFQKTPQNIQHSRWSLVKADLEKIKIPMGIAMEVASRERTLESLFECPENLKSSMARRKYAYLWQTMFRTQ